FYTFNKVEDECEEYWLGPDCLRVPKSITGTGTNPTVTVRGLSPTLAQGGRSRAWTTVVMEGDLYTCEWIAKYDGETEQQALEESPMVQGSLTMYRRADSYGRRNSRSTWDQTYRKPLLPYSPQYQGYTPFTV